jgi:hypothetical protein
MPRLGEENNFDVVLFLNATRIERNMTKTSAETNSSSSSIKSDAFGDEALLVSII